MKTVSLRINLSNIDMAKVYEGKKGNYLDAVLFLKDEKDQYDNNGMITQSISKEEREKGVKGAILGNAKIIGQAQPKQQAQPNYEDTPSDSLPF